MFDNYIAVDWAKANMAIARLTKISDKAHVTDVPSNLEELKVYLKNLRGSKSLTFEETTTSHWLYVELKPLVDQLIVCDPYRNKLLSDGPKNDAIDAVKLVKLLRGNLLKPVFHSFDRLIELRALLSAYNDLIQRGVRLKNQRSALLRSKGKESEETFLEGDEAFIINRLDRAIEAYENEWKEYHDLFEEKAKMFPVIAKLKTIPGIGLVGAVKIAAIVVSAERFPHKNQFHAYCGLVRLEKMSGHKSYGSRAARANRDLKSVFKTAALSAVRSNNCFTRYYNYMCQEQRLPDYKARHCVSRLVATAALAVMRSGKRFNPEQIGAIKSLIK